MECAGDLWNQERLGPHCFLTIVIIYESAISIAVRGGHRC